MKIVHRIWIARMNLLELPVEIIWNVLEFLDLESLEAIRPVLCDADAPLVDVLRSEMRKRIIARSHRIETAVANLSDMMDNELFIVSNVIRVIDECMYNPFSFCINIVETQIDRGTFWLTDSVQFGRHKWVFTLYCKLNLVRLEAVLQNVLFDRKTLNFVGTHLYQLPTDYSIHVARTVYPTILEDRPFDTNSHYSLVTYHFGGLKI
jgi:hypothetical protein